MDFSKRVALGVSLLAIIAGCNKNGLVTAPVQADQCANSTPETSPTPFASGATAAGSGTTAQRYAIPAYRPNEGGMSVSANAASSPSATDLLTAMDADPSVIVSSQLTAADPRAVAVFDSLGTLAPTSGSTFAFMSTGIAGSNTPKAVDPSATGTDAQPGTDFSAGPCPGSSDANQHDCSELSVTFTVPAGMHSVSFDFNFMSTEYPEFVGSPYNDEFVVSESSPSYNYANIVYDSSHNPISINSVLFTETCQQLAGTGFDDGASVGFCDAGGTGMLTTQTPVAPGETVTLKFDVYDYSDGIYDSAVMMDHLVISPNQVSNPNTGGQQVAVDCIWPNHGPTAGGTDVRIHGSNFTNVQAVTFGGQAATSFNVVSSTLIKAVTPATSFPGPVDVEVTAQPAGTLMVGTLSGGYTYDDGSSGTGP